MKISVSEAKAQLTELVRRAEAGEEVILTRHGQPAVRLLPVPATPTAETRADIIQKAQALAAKKLVSGPTAARSQDFLYGDDGMPK